MASDQDKLNYSRLRARGASAPQVVPRLPQLPPSVIKRFPELEEWQNKVNEQYRNEFAVALQWHIPPGE